MIRELAEGIWACEQDDGPRIIRQVVIAGEESVLLVDTGLPGVATEELLPLIAGLGTRALTLLITHPDADHLGGTAEILAARPATRVLAGAPDLPLVGDPERIIRERYARFSVHDDVPFGDEAAERARDRAGLPFAGAEGAYPEIPVELGGRTARVIATPGHSAGHVSAWIADAGVLAAGDAVMGAGIPTRAGTLMIPPMYAPPAAYRATIERVRSLPVRIFASGHEPILRDDGIGAFLDLSQAASDRIAVLVASALDESPQTLLEICGRVHAAYGGLPADGAAALAMTVDGHLDDLIAAELAVIASDNPRRFRSLA